MFKTLTLLIFGLLVLVISWCSILWYRFEVSEITSKKPISSWDTIVYPEEYHIRIVHIWGLDVWNVERILVSPWDWLEWYMNEPDYLKSEWAPYYMNNEWYLMWFYCHEWYSLKNCWSDSEIFNSDSLVDDWYCQISIEPKKVYWRIECIKK